MKKSFDLFQQSDNKKKLVIFIHGFTGTHDTWEIDGKKPFIDELFKMPNLKENYNWALFNYTSESSGENKPSGLIQRLINESSRKFTGNQRQYNLSIENISSTLESWINVYIQENELNTVNLYFISHSMGGIITKNFIP